MRKTVVTPPPQLNKYKTNPVTDETSALSTVESESQHAGIVTPYFTFDARESEIDQKNEEPSKDKESADATREIPVVELPDPLKLIIDEVLAQKY